MNAASLDIVSHSVAQTQRLGARLGALLSPGDLILLHGDLGSGKTTFTQGLAQGLGITDKVNSPTFILVREYEGRLPLYHMDFYRLDKPAEALEIGLESYMDVGGVCVVEWPEHAQGLPTDHLDIRLRFVSDTKRSLRFEPTSQHYADLVLKFRQSAFGI